MSEDFVLEGLCGTPCIQWKIEGDHACHRCDIILDQEREDLGLDNDFDIECWDDPY